MIGKFCSFMMPGGSTLSGEKIEKIATEIIKSLSDENLTYAEAKTVLEETLDKLGSSCVVVPPNKIGECKNEQPEKK